MWLIAMFFKQKEQLKLKCLVLSFSSFPKTLLFVVWIEFRFCTIQAFEFITKIGANVKFLQGKQEQLFVLACRLIQWVVS